MGAGALFLLTQLAACAPVVGWPLPCDDCDTDTNPSAAHPPHVRGTLPAADAVHVALNSPVVAIFDVWMDHDTITPDSFQVHGPDGAVAGTVAHIGDSAFFYPTADLALNSVYEATVTIAVHSRAGLAMQAPYVWTFSTGAYLDNTRPSVILVRPHDGAVEVPIFSHVTATFSESMDPATITETSFLLTGADGNDLPGTVTYDEVDAMAKFTPDALLEAGSVYGARVRSGVTDLAGNTMGRDEVWLFTTAALDWPLEPVPLGSLTDFVAVSGSGLDNSNSNGTTTLNGDVGLSPITSCLGDGLPCTMTNPVINGGFYAADSGGVAAQAKADLVTAYADAMSRPAGTLMQNLSDETLSPGVYTSETTMSLSVGSMLVLDAEGDENAVWIFQVGDSLNVEDDVQVFLSNGAKAQNVYWAVSGAATLGAEVSFQGSILASASNTMGPGSELVGRLLCTNGAVTLQSNTISLPSP